MNILITGATGMIGSRLTKDFLQRGHKVIAVTRNAQKTRAKLPQTVELIECHLNRKPSRIKIENIDAVIHLAGENIAAHRWTERIKQEIYDSRISSTRNLIASLATEPKVFISANAIGYYGNCGNKNLDETSEPGTDFLAHLCKDWETASQDLHQSRKVFIRTGLVLAKNQGLLGKTLPAFRLGLGIPLSDGRQWMSWIHIDDLIQLYVWALETESVSGPINAVAPNPVTNSEFTQSLGQALERPTLPAMPTLTNFAMKIVLGELAEVLTYSQKAFPTVALKNGFQFQFSNLDLALKDCLK